MQAYQYQHGDSPLEGYTIQHAIGRGGFGEVYYALSDSGRQVALKAVQGYEQIELRGVSQCMNLKNPHLVTIFDVRYNEQGKPFVIMEYVGGPSLQDLLTEAPDGLGEQKAAYFLREIGKGLTFLHDSGIVHRDLKPGNIFYEDGYVKIGDYGLSKAMTPSRHSGQTMTVGTVHYMAPEIGAGSYNKSIDIYALGVLLYEMLRGAPPYGGTSVGEILMKHIAGKPDLKDINEPFASAIDRAMEKDPARRFQSVQELVEAVFGSEQVQTSVSLFAPNSLTLVAGRAAGELAGAGSGAKPRTTSPTAPPLPAPVLRPIPAVPPIQAAAPHPQPPVPPPLANAGQGDAWRSGGWPAGKAPDPPKSNMEAAGVSIGRAVAWGQAQVDGEFVSPNPYGETPLQPGQRRMLAAVTTLVIAAGAAILSSGWDSMDRIFQQGILAAAMIASGAIGANLARRKFNLQAGSGMPWRLAIGGTVCILTVAGAFLFDAFLTEGEVSRRMGSDAFVGMVVAVCAVMFMLNWRKLVAPDRLQRITVGSAFIAGILAAIVAALTDGSMAMSAGIAAGIALASQVACSLAIDGQSSTSKAGSAVRPSTAVVRVSPCKRTPAAILCGCWIFGIGGLHRFYVGKVFTGLLWLCTFGLFGLGQLVDFILILSGRFTDGEDRPLLMWQSPHELRAVIGAARPAGIDGKPPSQQVEARPVGSGGNWTGPLMTFIAATLVFAAVLTGLAVAADAPAIIAAGFPDPGLIREFQREMGADWQVDLDRIIVMGMGTVMVLTAGTLVIARRRQGGGAMFRAVVGVFGLAMTVATLRGAMAKVNWRSVVGQIEIGRDLQAFGTMLRQMQEAPAIFAAVLMLASLIILCWPAEKQKTVLGESRGKER